MALLNHNAAVDPNAGAGGVSLLSGTGSTSVVTGGKKGDPTSSSQTSGGAHEGSPGPSGEEFELLLVWRLL